MRTILAALAVAALAGCGVETAGTAAAAAAARKQEIEQGKKTLERMQKAVADAEELSRRRAESAGEEK
jgi:curli biogenesis system outer membrane secretion channel CsgG